MSRLHAKTVERLSRVIALRDGMGLTLERVGEALGCSIERARQLYARAVRQREEQQNGYPFVGLSTAARHFCDNANLHDREQLLAFTESGRLGEALYQYRNFGWVTYCEIVVWLGLPKPERKPPVDLKKLDNVKPCFQHRLPTLSQSPVVQESDHWKAVLRSRAARAIPDSPEAQAELRRLHLSSPSHQTVNKQPEK